MKKYLLLFLIISLGGVICNIEFWQKVMAAPVSKFTQTINSGSLSVDIVDSNFVAVANPAVAMNPVSFSVACQDATGTFGTSTERIYVKNPDAADGVWTVSLAGSSTSAIWESAGTGFDFNDPGGLGCSDSDSDTLGGQMTVNPSVGTLSVGQCSSCDVTNVSKGSLASFDAVASTPTNAITILDATSNSDDVGDWYLTGVAVSQKVPAEQPIASDYNIDMVLSIVTK